MTLLSTKELPAKGCHNRKSFSFPCITGFLFPFHSPNPSPIHSHNDIRVTNTICLLSPSDMVCCVAGITSDANVLINELRAIAQRHTLQFGDPIPCEQLVMRLCDVKQAYTQYGGALPTAPGLHCSYDHSAMFVLFFRTVAKLNKTSLFWHNT